MPEPYDPQKIEPIWQEYWARERFAAADTAAEKDLYMLMMFPYPSGDLHVGHGRNYILGDCLFRMFLMQGRRVLNPMGWDAFGLPAENAAIKRSIHPREWTLSNIERMKRQFRVWGILYDWDKEIASCEPTYYRWNQWLFVRMLERGLAYRGKSPVNWCSSCKTVLANEQVVNGGCERCGTTVVQRDLEQWFLRITAYADRLLEGLDRLEDWSEKVKVMQRNWIGRSEGAEFTMRVEGRDDLDGFARLHDASRHGVRHDVRGAGPGAPAGRRGDHARSPRGGRVVRRAGAPPDRDRPAVDRGRGGEARRVHRQLRGQPVHRPARADLPGRLRADVLRHRRDHGGARPGPARLGLRDGVRPADRPDRPAPRRDGTVRPTWAMARRSTATG